MNYIAEIKAFNDYLLLNKLSTSEIALWYALMHVNNKTGWLIEFTVSNLVLQTLTSLSRSTLDSARNRLKQRGLIDYQAGRSNQAGKYKIISLVCNISDTGQDTTRDTGQDVEKPRRKAEGKKDTSNSNSPSKSGYEEIINKYTDNEKLKEAIWGYIQMRINKRSKLTDRALRLVLEDLSTLSSDIDNQIKILNKSVKNNWSDLYEQTDKRGGGVEDAGDKKGFTPSKGFKTIHPS